MLTTSFFFFSCIVPLSIVVAQYLPDTKAITIRELEHIYLDAAPNGMLSAVSPCEKYFDPSTGAASNSFGRQTAAEWIRVASHDFVTGNIYTQKGGLDASIGFETDRGENVGIAFNDALNFFSFFFSQKTSMSDLIALGTVIATGACGGPHVKFRAGRIDATTAGPTGVPEPHTPLQQTLTQFGNAGFNTQDTIALTACGHTLGGVHQKDFPQVTTDGTTTPEGSDGRIAFDETTPGFDFSVAADYVSGEGSKGGPLVTTTNTTVQSDLRLYTADNNQTIDLMAQSNDYFKGQCSSLFQRMIETVPSQVRFISPAVDPTATTNLKPYAVSLDLDSEGSMTLSGSFRYVQVAGAAPSPDSLTITLISRVGRTEEISTTATMSSTDTGTGIWGPTRSYAFKLTFPASTGLSGVVAGTTTFYFQDNMFLVPSLSSVSPQLPPFATSPDMNNVATYTANTTVAYLSPSPPPSLLATLAIPTSQPGTISPAISTETVTLDLIDTANGYGFYSALISKDLSAKFAYGTSVDVTTAEGTAPGLMFAKPFMIVG